MTGEKRETMVIKEVTTIIEIIKSMNNNMKNNMAKRSNQTSNLTKKNLHFSIQRRVPMRKLRRSTERSLISPEKKKLQEQELFQRKSRKLQSISQKVKERFITKIHTIKELIIKTIDKVKDSINNSVKLIAIIKATMGIQKVATERFIMKKRPIMMMIMEKRLIKIRVPMLRAKIMISKITEGVIKIMKEVNKKMEIASTVKEAEEEVEEVTEAVTESKEGIKTTTLTMIMTPILKVNYILMISFSF